MPTPSTSQASLSHPSITTSQLNTSPKQVITSTQAPLSWRKSMPCSPSDTHSSTSPRTASKCSTHDPHTVGCPPSV
jgi:hypothetical protein